jgi:putative transposase
VNRRSRADGDYAIEDADRRSRREAFRQLVRPDRNGAAQTRLKDAELVIADGAPGREKALAGPWPEVLVQRCTIHRHRNLLAHAPDRLHEEISADYKGMIYAATKQEVEAKRKAFIRKWRLKCPAVAALLEEAGDKLFTFTRTFTECRKANGNRFGPRMQSNDCTGSKFRPSCHRQKQPRCCPGLCWLRGQITTRKVDGWQSLSEKPSDPALDLAVRSGNRAMLEIAPKYKFQPKSRQHPRSGC